MEKETADLLIKKGLEEEVGLLMKLPLRPASKEMEMKEKICDFVEKISNDDQFEKCLGWAIVSRVLGQIKEFSNDELRVFGQLLLTMNLYLDADGVCFSRLRFHLSSLDKEKRAEMLKLLPEATFILRDADDIEAQKIRNPWIWVAITLERDYKTVLPVIAERIKEGDAIAKFLLPAFNEISTRYGENAWLEGLAFLREGLSLELFEKVKKEFEDFFQIKIQ